MQAFLLLVLFVSLSGPAQADSSRVISTDDLLCLGQAAGEASIMMNVKARPGSTELEISGGITKSIRNSSSLTISSEGSVFIQQVSNGLGYNLYLGGEELRDVLNGRAKVVKVRGSISFFHPYTEFDLECEGYLY